MMKRGRALFLLLALLGCPGALRAAEPPQPGEVIDSGAGLLQWAPLIATLANKGPLYSTFTERRWFGVRKTPVELRGELRYSPELGLCLSYTGEDPRMVILDSEGVLLRNGKGRQRSAPKTAEVTDLVRSVLTVMQMDLEQLRAEFVLRGARDESEWRLDLEPRAPERAKVFGAITVFGSAQDVRRLVFRKGARDRIEILIGQTRAVTAFAADERARYFR